MKYSINVLRNQMDTSTANQINCVEANIEGIFHNKEFKDGNEFLNYLSNNDIKEGVSVFKVGKQKVSIQFNEEIRKGKYWWLYLDKWLYLDSRFIKDLKLIWGQDN